MQSGQFQWLRPVALPMDADLPPLWHSAPPGPGSEPVFSQATRWQFIRTIASGFCRATEDDTVYLEELFDIGWPKAPHRVLRNSTVAEWEAAGRPVPGKRPGEGEVVATSKSRGPIVRYRSYTPAADADGDIDALSLWAGQSVALVHKIQPAAEIVREINSEARAILLRLAQ